LGFVAGPHLPAGLSFYQDAVARAVWGDEPLHPQGGLARPWLVPDLLRESDREGAIGWQ
jgi:hypothetical protein